MNRIVSLFVLVGCLFLSGCCKTCPPPKIVPVYKSCKLPGKILLEFPASTKEGCLDSHVCFNRSEFGKMTLTIEKMALWIKQARMRCGSEQPTTRPSE